MKSCIVLFVSVIAVAAGQPAAVRLFDAKLNPTQRANACFELRGKTDPDMVAAMGRAMEDPGLLSCAAENLRIAGAVDALKTALDSPSAEVRATAARLLGSFQKSELLETLYRMAQDENALVSTNALGGLSQYQDAAVIPFLAGISRKGGMTGDLALDRLAQIEPGAALLVARELLASSQVPDQLYAMRVIGAYGNSSDLPALKKIASRNSESLTQHSRGFGLMPPINLSRAAEGAIAAIEGRAAASAGVRLQQECAWAGYQLFQLGKAALDSTRQAGAEIRARPRHRDRILSKDAELSTELIPGFRIPVKRLFETL